MLLIWSPTLAEAVGPPTANELPLADRAAFLFGDGGDCSHGFTSKRKRARAAGQGTSWDALFSFQRQRVRSAPQWLWQLGDVCRDPPRLILGKQFRRRSPPWLVLEIDIGECLAAMVADDETRLRLFDRPGPARSRVATSRSNHLVGAEDKRLRKTDAEHIRCLEIENQFEFCWLLDRKIGRVRAFENFIYVGDRAAHKIG
jgi:hypothetical protein